MSKKRARRQQLQQQKHRQQQPHQRPHHQRRVRIVIAGLLILCGASVLLAQWRRLLPPSMMLRALSPAVEGNVAASVTQSGTTPTNLALGQATTQSSDDYGGLASRAVDGNTSGNWADSSLTHTTNENQPWWQVDLAKVQSLSTIDVWNRTDCCAERLSNYSGRQNLDS